MKNNLRDTRRRALMTQEDLSRKSGVSRTTIVSIENGDVVKASTKTLFKLADALGVTVNDLFFAQQDQHAGQTAVKEA